MKIAEAKNMMARVKNGIANKVTAWAAWTKKRPRNIAITAAGGVAAAMAAVLFAKFVLPPLLLITVLCTLFWGDKIWAAILAANTPPPTLENGKVCWEVTNFIFEAFTSARGVLGEFAYMPLTAREIYDPGAYLVMVNAVQMLKLRLLAKREVPHEDLRFLRTALQGIINARILEGRLLGCPWVIRADNAVPLLKVATGENAGAYLTFGVLLTNTPQSVEAARLADAPPSELSPDDSDPLF